MSEGQCAKASSDGEQGDRCLQSLVGHLVRPSTGSRQERESQSEGGGSGVWQATYSGGMPLLYLVGAAYCFISYWVDKAHNRQLGSLCRTAVSGMCSGSRIDVGAASH